MGSVVGTRLVDGASPIAYGYDEKVAAYCDNGPIFSLDAASRASGAGGGWATSRRSGRRDAARLTIRILRWGGRGWKFRKSQAPKFGKVRRSPTSKR